MKSTIFMICITICSLLGSDAYAQTNSTNNNSTGLYNGTEYAKHPISIQGIPYLEGKYILGELLYEGKQYTAVPLKYDLVKDELITTYLDGVSEMRFIPEFVSNFTINGRKFIYIGMDTVKNITAPIGYYEVLLADQISFYAKRRKYIKENISTQTIVTRFLDEDHLYVKMDGILYKVSSRGDLLKLFKDKKKELVSFINDNNLNFRDQKELAIQKTIAAYNSLKH